MNKFIKILYILSLFIQFVTSGNSLANGNPQSFEDTVKLKKIEVSALQLQKFNPQECISQAEQLIE